MGTSVSPWPTPHPTGVLENNGSSKRAMSDILNAAGQGRVITAAVPKGKAKICGGSLAGAYTRPLFSSSQALSVGQGVVHSGIV